MVVLSDSLWQAYFGKINDLRLHAFETIILRQNANGILSSDSSLVFDE